MTQASLDDPIVPVLTGEMRNRAQFVDQMADLALGGGTAGARLSSRRAATLIPGRRFAFSMRFAAR